MINQIPLILLSAICVRMCVFGGSLGESIAAAGLCGLYGFMQFMISKQQATPTDDIKKELADIRTTMNALKIGKSLGRM